jgi:hypothetical protein
MKTSRSLVLILAFAVFSLIIYAIVRTAWLGEQNVVGVNALPSLVDPVLTPSNVSSEGDPDQILVNDATDLANPNRAESAERLILLAKTNKDSYANISKVLVNELRTSCGSDELLTTNAQFTKVKSLAIILARMKDLGALDTLIDCSNRRRDFGGLSYTNYPTFEPIADFGELAIPSLISKYRSADTSTKCWLANIISMIGGPKASHSLKDLRRNEIDDTLKKCLENCLRASSNRER